MTDLFQKKTSKERLKDWILNQEYIKTSMVIQWGVGNFSNRALRNTQEFAQQGLIRRLTDEEKGRLFGRIKEDVWIVEKD